MLPSTLFELLSCDELNDIYCHHVESTKRRYGAFLYLYNESCLFMGGDPRFYR